LYLWKVYNPKNNINNVGKKIKTLKQKGKVAKKIIKSKIIEKNNKIKS
jgi:hypothetical protein